MEEHENLYEKIQEILGSNPGSLKILEQQIDVDLQVEYFECSKRLKDEVESAWAIDQIKYLGEPDYSAEVKKNILARLATIDSVECYRAIESFVDQADEALRNWALLALNECRMHLESKLLEENQIFISTGLGGKEQKLRYFVVVMSRNRQSMTQTQKKVVRNEFDFILRKFDAEIEKVSFSGYLATILLLLPMTYSLKAVFQEAIDECNQYGDFLSDDFIVTNVKTLTFDEIERFIERKSDEDSD
jgi:hypothetical protein